MTLYEYYRMKKTDDPKWTMDRLADWLGVTGSTLRGYLYGTKTPGIRFILRAKAQTNGIVTPADWLNVEGKVRIIRSFETIKEERKNVYSD